MTPGSPPVPSGASVPDRRLRLVEQGSEAFPAILDEVSPAVKALWVLGRDIALLGPCVAVVGARVPTSYGLEVARALAADLGSTGVCVVSGLARGIDAAAHEGALSAGAPTVAVLGTGADRPYPAANKLLYERVAEAGAIVSELPLGAGPRKEHFPLRNRIIAGLSLAVVLVQGRARSGALGTVRAATELGREVLAVPGDVRSDLSTGPHELLRDGARLCAGAGDVLDALRDELSRPLPPARPPTPLPADPIEASVLGAFLAGPARADQVAGRSGLDVVTVNRMLTRLELSGTIVRGASGTYRRAR